MSKLKLTVCLPVIFLFVFSSNAQEKPLKISIQQNSDYVIKAYQPGFEDLHKKIGLEVAKSWAWPFESFTDIYTDQDFDPETALSCFKGENMVGFVLVNIMAEGPGILKNEGMGAYLDIPRVLHGHEQASDLLMESIIHVLRSKGAKFIRTRVNTMRKNSIKLAEKWGFKGCEDFPLGYKIYYTYDLRCGRINYPTNKIETFDPERDLDECANRVAYYFKISKERSKNWILEINSRKDLVNHLVIRKDGEIQAYSFALPHYLDRNIIATLYIEASSEDYLKQLIAKTIDEGIRKNHKSFLVDVIGHLIKYKNTMLSLGFENSATWGIYEKYLQDDFQELKGPYFGQTAPSDFAEIFLDGIISKVDSPEMCAAFTKDGKEFFYNALHNNNWAIFSTKEINGRWIKPRALSFTGDYVDRDFTISPDGNRIYFGSNRPKTGSTEAKNDLDVFVTERISSDLWSNPENIGLPVNTNRSENYPSVARNGNLYFFSVRESGFGGCDIYVSKLVDGKHAEPKNMGSAINSEKHDWDSYVAPDESYIIFSSQDREDTIGKQDLYISFRKKDGSWTKARNMGSSINSEHDEICPSISLDGKYLFFTSRRRGKADIFWIKAEIIKKSRPGDH